MASFNLGMNKVMDAFSASVILTSFRIEYVRSSTLCKNSLYAFLAGNFVSSAYSTNFSQCLEKFEPSTYLESWFAVAKVILDSASTSSVLTLAVDDDWVAPPVVPNMLSTSVFTVVSDRFGLSSRSFLISSSSSLSFSSGWVIPICTQAPLYWIPYCILYSEYYSSLDRESR